jgi:biotin synthase
MLEAVLKKDRLDRADLIRLLRADGAEETERLFKAAYEVKCREVGRRAYFRGLVEFSNRCRKNCFYCGIRAGNSQLTRYDLTKAEILEMAQWAYDQQYGSVTLQSGERQDQDFVSFINDLLPALKKIGDGSLGLTLSLGEQSEEVYKKWFELGAHRYLLRLETSNPVLYKKIHPDNAEHSFVTRVNCLNTLKRLGYQLGTGVMVGLPGQTEADLADDILFFEEIDADMIGMGPYVVHPDTPIGREVLDKDENRPEDRRRRLVLGLKMIAATRLHLKNINIASATALQALDPDGRELGLQAGANILMPLLTPTLNRSQYKLYDNKPGLDESALETKNYMAGRVRAIGEEVGFGQWGDSPHALKERPAPLRSARKINGNS